MNRFLDIVPLALTPLTPIHIGCGVDFEPTNYVIDGGILYHFEPSRLLLTEEDRRLLRQSANKRGDEAIREVQRFFHAKRQECRRAGKLEVPVAVGVGERYEERIGQIAQRESGGKAVINLLAIERTAHHPHSGRAYLPGSGLKGAIRTAWLNQLDKDPIIQRDPMRGPREYASDVEAELLGGRFHADPFRLVDIADASGSEIGSRICFAVDRRKQPRTDAMGRTVQKDLSVCCEVVGGAQFRALQGEIRFECPPQSTQPAMDRRIADFSTLARACNSFYLARFNAELGTLQSLTPGPWLDGFRKMIEAIKPSLDEGSAMLVRVGRHSGAESVTLDRRRWIQIRSGRGQSHWAREATTIWLAADRESSTSDMVPFGWAIVEPSEASPPAVLERWCKEEKARSASAARPGIGTTPRPAAKAGSVALSQYRFRERDRVTKEGEQATVVRDVRSADARMDVRYDDGEIEEVSVTGWRKT